jgi:hypothetical protein
MWLGWEWPSAWDRSDPLRPPRHVGRCVQENPLGFQGLVVKCSVKSPKGAAVGAELTGGEVSRRPSNTFHDEVWVVQRFRLWQRKKCPWARRPARRRWRGSACRAETEERSGLAGMPVPARSRVCAVVHGRWNLPDASLGSGLAARRRVGATWSGAQAITGGLTAAASLATNTRKDGAARLGRTTTPWSAVERAQPWPRTASARKPAHWGVRRRRGRRAQRRSEQGEKQAWRARVGEGGGSCKRLPNMAQRPASHGSERGSARVFGLIMAHKAGARPWLDGQAPQRKGERGGHQWSKGTQW